MPMTCSNIKIKFIMVYFLNSVFVVFCFIDANVHNMELETVQNHGGFYGGFAPIIKVFVLFS